METETCECNGPVVGRRLDRYLNPPIGIGGVVIEKAAIETYCSVCGTVQDIMIPDVEGLIAAAAVTRVKNPLKLNGEEIRFLRRALDCKAKDLAAKLQVRPETFSKWENDAEPIGPSYEKLLRIEVGSRLRKKAPRIPFSTDEIMSMDLRGFRSEDAEVEMIFTLVPLAKAQRQGRVQAEPEAGEAPIRKAWG